MKPMDRSDFGELYHRVFGKGASRKDCRQGWQRWQAIWKSGLDEMALHPPGEPVPERQATDFYLVAMCSALRYVARVSEEHFQQLPAGWEEFSRIGKLAEKLDRNPRSAARTFLHNALVDGYGQDPTIGSAMGACIAWLVASHETVGPVAADYHMLGFDIAYVPGPAGQKRMFNFRLIMTAEFDPSQFTAARSLPLPQWQPPPQ